MTRTTPAPVRRAPRPGWAVHPWADVCCPSPSTTRGTMAPAGQLWATLDDLARFAAFLLGDTGDVLSPATLEEMGVPAGVDSDGDWGAYGLGVQVQRSGGAHPGRARRLDARLPRRACSVDRDEGDGVVALRNATSGGDGGLPPGLLDVAGASASRRVGDAVDARRRRRSPLALLGPWYWGPSPYVLRLRPDGLLHLAGLGRPGRASRFRRDGDGTWTGLDGYYAGETMTVTPDADGPRDLRLHPHAVRPGAAGAGRGRGRRLALEVRRPRARPTVQAHPRGGRPCPVRPAPRRC